MKSLESLLEGLTHKLTAKNIAVGTTGIAAAATSATPTQQFGYDLTANGLWIFNYAQWMQVIASFYIVCLLFKMLAWPVIKYVHKLIKERKQ